MRNLTVVFLLLLSLGAFAQEAKIDKHIRFPNIEWDERRFYLSDSLVTLAHQDTVRHKFFFKNTGGVQLIIDEVNSSCSCTVPEFSSTVEPGKIGFIQLTTTYGQLQNVGSVYAVIMSNTYEKYHKIELNLKRKED